ncbi:MAG: hypothetical protein M3071_23385 [Actinomycetota bacterium]|nr:hypothetical protein [Actinomycetota bacterium]
MSSFEDAIWSHLVDRHGADRVELRVLMPKRRPRPLAASAGAAVLAVAIAAVVLVASATSNAPPAYAFTQNADGTVTVSLTDLATGIPALNARFAQLGIRETVVPIEAGCTAATFEPVSAGQASMSQTMTVSNVGIPAGDQGFLAARQMPNGQVLLAQGTTAQPIPSCFPATAARSYPPGSQG